MIYDQNKVTLIDTETGECNILPKDACQLVNPDLARKLEFMEGINPSLSRKQKINPSRQFEKTGVDFQSNQPVYEPRPLTVDLYKVSDLESFLEEPFRYAYAEA